MFENVLIATDGSEKSEESVSEGLDLAESLGAHVHVVYVVETEATYILTVGLGDQEMEEYKQYGDKTVTDVVDRAAERGLDGTGVVRTGNVAAEIVEYAEDTDIDLIVMGKQGRGAINRYIGSTAEKVARMSDVPVTIVGAGAK